MHHYTYLLITDDVKKTEIQDKSPDSVNEICNNKIKSLHKSKDVCNLSK